MSLHAQPIAPVPADTLRVARAAFPKGNPYLTLRGTWGELFTDADFATLFPSTGQPALAPWRLAWVTLLQFRERLADRQAAEAVRARIDWKYLLGLELTDPGFDFSVLSEFRDRLLAGHAEMRLLDILLERCRADGLLPARGQQRTDATHVLAAIRVLNRLELVGETLRAALNTLATEAPAWLQGVVPAVWYTRYATRIEDTRLPHSEAKRAAYAQTVGEDGFALLDALDAPRRRTGCGRCRTWSPYARPGSATTRARPWRPRRPRRRAAGRCVSRPIKNWDRPGKRSNCPMTPTPGSAINGTPTGRATWST